MLVIKKKFFKKNNSFKHKAFVANREASIAHLTMPYRVGLAAVMQHVQIVAVILSQGGEWLTYGVN